MSNVPQTRIESLVEAVTNTLIGFIISYLCWPIVGLILNLPYTSAQHFYITLIFTGVSVARGYFIRRFFNSHLNRFKSFVSRKINAAVND